MNDDPARMGRFTLRFADAHLEAEYVEDQARKSQRLIRLAALWGGGIILVTWALMGVAFPQVPNIHARAAAPFCVMLGVLASGYVLSAGTRFLRYHHHVLTASMCVLTAVTIGLIAAFPRAMIITVGLSFVIIHTFNVYALVRLRFPAAVACGWLTAVLFIGYLVAIGALGAKDPWGGWYFFSP